jgi:hypothetical protein
VSDFQSDFKQQLVAAAGALFEPANVASEGRVRGTRRFSVALAVVLGALALAAAAFAATQILGFGAPATVPRGGEHPSTSTGIGRPVPGAKRGRASAQLLPVSVPDPAGGLPWGMRIVRTTRGLVCLQVGRLLDGRVGILGQDGAFKDDGLFHELPSSVLSPDTCSQPGYAVIYNSEGLPAAGAMPGPVQTCLYPGAAQTQDLQLPHCPAGDERLLAFGVLGPHAVSVSYKTEGVLHTIATVGGHGAYLIVLPQPTIRPASTELPLLRHLVPGTTAATLLDRYPGLGSSSMPLGHFPISYQPSPVAALEFRFGGQLCQAGSEPLRVGPPVCTSALARGGQFAPEIPAGLHTDIAVRARKAAFGYELTIEFAAPAAVHDASTAYAVQYSTPDTPACGDGATAGQPIERDVRKGQVIRQTILVSRRAGCRGPIHGEILFGHQPDALTGPSPGEAVGGFVFNLP